MKSYYKKRAPVYDRVYEYPERQQDLRVLESFVANEFADKRVLEVAAGTGYWTQFIASQAQSVLAADATEEALIQVRSRPNSGKISTQLIDAYSVEGLGENFDAAFAGLWISHVPKQTLASFIRSMCRCLKPDSTVVFIDNSKAQCERLPLSHSDDKGNTYQDRSLDDGSVHRVLKNFPTELELLTAIDNCGSEPQFLELENFWMFKFTTH